MSAAALRILIGTYTGDAGAAGVSKGIYTADWNGDTGGIGPVTLFHEMDRPSFLAPHPTLPILYASSEIDGFGGKKAGAVATLRLEGAGAVRLDLRTSHGSAPCHAVTDPKGEFLVLSNYSSGNAAVYPLEQGVPQGDGQPVTLEGHGPDASRQAGPHAHSAIFEPGGDRFWIQDLGTDRLWGFVLDRGTKTARPLTPPFTALAPGAGPRHLVFHPKGNWAWVINELNSSLTALALDRGAGRLTVFQVVETLPAGHPAMPENACADVHVSPDGLFLYGSNRGHDSIAVWRINQDDGRLTIVQHTPCGGGHPRNFGLSPDGRWLVCANMHSNNLAVFRRDPATGQLAPVGTVVAPKPTCVRFVSRA